MPPKKNQDPKSRQRPQPWMKQATTANANGTTDKGGVIRTTVARKSIIDSDTEAINWAEGRTGIQFAEPQYIQRPAVVAGYLRFHDTREMYNAANVDLARKPEDSKRPNNPIDEQTLSRYSLTIIWP
jgi:hypothetical protein